MRKFSTVDRLGALRSQIADLQDEVKRAEAALQAKGPGVYEGAEYRASVSVFERDSVAWKKIAEKFEPSRQMVQAYTTTSQVSVVKVSARKKEAA